VEVFVDPRELITTIRRTLLRTFAGAAASPDEFNTHK
jgi:hypothetical protein